MNCANSYQDLIQPWSPPPPNLLANAALFPL